MGTENQQFPSLGNRKTHDVDAYVGNRVRLRRSALGLSQNQLAEAIGVSFQQIQKYEKGTNRIGCSRIFAISKALRVSIIYFFDALDEIGLSEDEGYPYELDPVLKRETLELMRAYHKIQNPKDRKKVLDYVRALAEESQRKQMASHYKEGL